MHRIRYLLARHPVLFWVPATAAALVVAWVVSSAVDRATAEARRLGPPVLVALADRWIEVGEVLDEADVEWRRLPRGALPDAPLAEDPVGRMTLVPLAPGEVVLAGKLAPEGVRGIAALVPPGMQALAVPVGPGTPRVRRGDRVDVLAVVDGGAARVVAVGAPVVDVGDEAVAIALAPEEAAVVAAVVARGTVTLALVSPLG